MDEKDKDILRKKLDAILTEGERKLSQLEAEREALVREAVERAEKDAIEKLKQNIAG